MANKLGCLIVHGFGGSIKEISPLAEALSRQGYQVATPILKGHTGLRKDLIGVTYNHWLHSAQEGLENLKITCDSIVVIGFSMGGLVAFNLATEYNFSGIVTINTPIYFWDFQQIAVNIWEDIKNARCFYLKKFIKSNLKTPFSAKLQFLHLLRKTKALIATPIFPAALVLQTLDDDTVQARSAKFIYDRLNCPDKKIQYYKQGGHLVLISGTAQKAINDIIEFLRNLENKLVKK